jgi:hypothetical protein
MYQEQRINDARSTGHEVYALKLSAARKSFSNDFFFFSCSCMEFEPSIRNRGWRSINTGSCFKSFVSIRNHSFDFIRYKHEILGNKTTFISVSTILQFLFRRLAAPLFPIVAFDSTSSRRIELTATHVCAIVCSQPQFSARLLAPVI